MGNFLFGHKKTAPLSESGFLIETKLKSLFEYDKFVGAYTVVGRYAHKVGSFGEHKLFETKAVGTIVEHS